MDLKVCAAKSFAAGGASEERRRTLEVAQASDYDNGGWRVRELSKDVHSERQTECWKS